MATKFNTLVGGIVHAALRYRRKRIRGLERDAEVSETACRIERNSELAGALADAPVTRAQVDCMTCIVNVNNESRWREP